MSPRIGVGFLGHGWMARVHAHALRSLDALGVLPFEISLVGLCGRDEARTREAAGRLGFDYATTDWQRVLDDPSIQVVANVASDRAHAEPSIAALRAEKHILCEKPLALDGPSALEMARVAEETNLLAACGFNYRFVPAIAYAHDLIRSGELGRVRELRGSYLQDWACESLGVPSPGGAGGSGVVSGLNHVLDLLLHVSGLEPTHVSADTIHHRRGDTPATFGGPVHTEDAYVAAVRLGDSCLARVEASSCALGAKARQTLEVIADRGAIRWDLEDLNHLELLLDADGADAKQGFRHVLATDPAHPFLDLWWPPGHTLGWEHSFVHQWLCLLQSVATDDGLCDRQASFRQGARIAQLCDGVFEAAGSGQRVALHLSSDVDED